MSIISTIVIAAITAFITTKIITIKYFDVIDGYVKGLLDDAQKEILEVIRDITLMK